MSMEDLKFVKEVVQKVWIDFIKHFDAKETANCLFQRPWNLINKNTMESILAAKHTEAANQLFLLHLSTNATIETLKRLCTMLHETSKDYAPHVSLAALLEGELKLQPMSLSHAVIPHLPSSMASQDPSPSYQSPDQTIPSQVNPPTVTKAVSSAAGRPARALTVSWSEPDSDRPITKYELQHTCRKTPSGGWISRNVTSPPTTLTNLDAGTVYRFRVRAVSDLGNGLFSEETEQTTSTNYRFAIMVANDNEMHATMHFLCSKYRRSEVKEDVQSYTCEGDEKLKGAITTQEQFSTQGKNRLNIFPITVDEIPGIVVKCSTMGSFTQMGSHRTTLQLMKEATEGGWDLKTIFIVGCCGTLPETEKNVEEQHDIDKEENEQGDSESPLAKKPKTDANIVSNPTVHHNKPNEMVPLGTVLVAREIIQYAMGKLEDGRTDWKPECCFKPDQVVDFNDTQYSDVVSDHACRIVKKVEGATFLSADFVIKGKDTALELAKLQKRTYVGFEMEGVGATKAVDDALIFLPGTKPEVVLVKGVSDKAEQYKNKEANFQCFSGKLMLRTEDSRQQMCAIMSLTLVLKYIIQNKANVYQ